MWGNNSLWFWFTFLTISNVEHLFMLLLAIWCLPGKMPIHIFCSFFNWVVCLLLSCMGCLYVLGINSLPVMSLANTFSHSVGYPFILLRASFAVQKLLSLIKFLALFPLLKETDPKKILLWFMSKSALPLFSSCRETERGPVAFDLPLPRHPACSLWKILGKE